MPGFEAETDWFNYTIKSADGRDFYEMADLRADVIVNDDYEIQRVVGIFTEEKDHKTGITTRIYLDPKHGLWADIEYFVISNDALMDSAREDEGIVWHTPRSVDEACMIGVGEWRRVK